MTRRLRSLLRPGGDSRGVTIIEFAIVSPVMVMLMMAIGDTLYQAYVQSMLSGAVQKAGRDSGIQGGDAQTGVIDGKVVQVMSSLMQTPTNSCATSPTGTTWCSTRKSYDTFTEVAPEPFVDSNGNGVRDPGECFTDVNNNKTWDADPGANGQGGAGAVTLYTMRITYNRLFPVARLFGWSSITTIQAATLLKNQPYASQVTTANNTVCT